MARGKKSKESEMSEDEKHPLAVSDESEVPSDSLMAEKMEEIPAEPVVEESKKISGSPLGKVRGKDLKNY